MSKPHLYCGRQGGNDHTLFAAQLRICPLQFSNFSESLSSRNINDWDVGRFHQPQVAAHLFCAAGNTVKLDIDRSDVDDDRVEIYLNLSVHQESHLERSSF